MSRYPYGSPRDPLLIRYDRYFEPHTLAEAKLSAWALATGARLPKGASGRRLNRGMLADVLLPDEPPPRATRPALTLRLWRALKYLFSGGKAPAVPTEAPAVAVADETNVTYIGRTNAAEAPAGTPAGDEQSSRPRAA